MSVEPSGAPPRGPILLVDDDADLRDSLQLVLEMRGFQVVTARDGAEALAYLIDNDPPSVVLLDVMMPGMNGSEFRQHQLADPRLAAIPVMLLTGAGAHGLDPRLVAGALFLRKPFDFDRLFDLLDELYRPAVPAD